MTLLDKQSTQVSRITLQGLVRSLNIASLKLEEQVKSAPSLKNNIIYLPLIIGAYQCVMLS